jgi:urease accessory protein
MAEATPKPSTSTAELEDAVLEASERGLTAGIDDLGSAALMVDFASMRHETQYTGLFRS